VSDFFSPDFLFRNAILGGLGVALLCSVLGIYLVLRRLVQRQATTLVTTHLGALKLFAHGEPGVKLRALDVPAVEPARALAGAALRRDGLAALPQLSEFETVRHFTRLSKMNVSIDAAMYPLGSCTMKYNPKLHEDAARLAGFSRLHPYAAEGDVQGALELMWELERMLAEVSGMNRLTFQPAAGAHGEFTGLLLIRAYFDTTTGPKTAPESYERIAAALERSPGDVLFVSDVTAELDAARRAGMRCALCVRGPEARGQATGHAVIHGFDEVSS